MKNILENIRTFLQRFKRQPKSESSAQVNVADVTPRVKGKADRFTIISWVFTILIVVTLLVSTILYKNSRPSTIIQSPLPTAESGTGQPQGGVPVAGSGGSGTSSILRELQLKTNIPERPRYDSVIYRVTRGDAMLSIADEYKITSETILYVNRQLEDNPHNLKPGMELTIPPVDGLYYEWQDGDTFETVAEKFDKTPEEIINFPGNRVDLTDPEIEPGTLAMIPGGSRELRNWAADLQTAGRSNNGLQMITAFQEIPMGQVTLGLIFLRRKAPMCMRQALAL